MSDREEYWWVNYDANIQPAEVTFRGEIPIHARLIGTRDIVPATAFRLIERLPASPRPVFEKIEAAQLSAPPPQSAQSVRLVWLIGIILLMLVYLFSGRIFDAIK
ncbi:hypothetical protein [Microvirga rosea]|uniref:hypothetical protein n=1 Tax=Microvirga rosea TaxID=2715425 RepID=UPI001D0B3F84|nr:hypothetical protein [Microvirga rosea]MCB8822795.1 hypothetical protein [Microvirga rosea]